MHTAPVPPAPSYATTAPRPCRPHTQAGTPSQLCGVAAASAFMRTGSSGGTGHRADGTVSTKGLEAAAASGRQVCMGASPPTPTLQEVLEGSRWSAEVSEPSPH